VSTSPGVREFVRGAVRFHILHHASAGDLHGSWMAEELAHHGHQISPGTLYPILHRLEHDGLLTSRHIVVGGRSRRVYRTTASGRKALREMKRVLQELADEVLG
jgi:DNA-binding PadR family transcriptional regulator